MVLWFVLIQQVPPHRALFKKSRRNLLQIVAENSGNNNARQDGRQEEDNAETAPARQLFKDIESKQNAEGRTDNGVYQKRLNGNVEVVLKFYSRKKVRKGFFVLRQREQVDDKLLTDKVRILERHQNRVDVHAHVIHQEL